MNQKASLGERSKKKMTQIVEKVHKGGGVKSKIKKVYISNVDYFETWGGGSEFSIFSQM